MEMEKVRRERVHFGSWWAKKSHYYNADTVNTQHNLPFLVLLTRYIPTNAVL